MMVTQTRRAILILCTQNELVEIYEFLIRLLRNWPEERMQRMKGRISYRILEVAQEQGLFLSLSGPSFYRRIGKLILDKKTLDRVGENEADKMLLLDNSMKLGVGGRGQRKYDDAELSEICQFLIRLLRDWPEQKLKNMTSRSILCKIWKLGLEEGLFERFPMTSFETVVRTRIIAGLNDLVDNKEDRRLILSNLHKLGIGIRQSRAHSRPQSRPHEELAEIFQYLIHLLRDWPEQKLKNIKTTDGSILSQIWKLGSKEGLFQKFTENSFPITVRKSILSDQRLDDLVDNEEDRQLILSNLHKFGIGVKSRRSGYYRRRKDVHVDVSRMEYESRDSSPYSTESTDSSQSYHIDNMSNESSDSTNSEINSQRSSFVSALEKINSSCSKPKFPAQKTLKVKKIGRLCSPKKIHSDKKSSKIEDELKEIKKLLLLERKEKMSTKKQFEELSKQMTDLRQENEKFAYQMQSKMATLENQIAALN